MFLLHARFPEHKSKVRYRRACVHKKKRQSGQVPSKEGSKARRLVACAKCGWRGRRKEDGGPCGSDPQEGSCTWARCSGVVRFGAKHAPKAPRGETRVRMLVRVLPRTKAALTPTQAAVLLDAAVSMEASGFAQETEASK